MKPLTILTAIVLAFSVLSTAHADQVKNVVTMEPVLDEDEKPVSIEEVKKNIEDHGSDGEQQYFSHVVSEEEASDFFLSDYTDGLSSQELRDIECLTEAIYFESVGEPELGQIAVANVILNRVNWNTKEREPHERHRIEFKDNVCDVIAFKIYRTYKKPVIVKREKKWIHKTYATCAFSYRCERGFRDRLQRVRNNDSWNRIKELAKDAYLSYNKGENVDPSKGATFYHATWMKNYPWWSNHYKKTARIGLHQFYRIE